MSTAPTFTGISSYATALQQVISRSLSIASLPLEQLQNRLQDLNHQSSALSGLDHDVSTLQSALEKIGTALGSGSYVATSSDAKSITAAVSEGAMEGTYAIDVSSVGSFSTSVSDAALPSVSDPTSSSISPASDYTLTVDGKTFDIKPSAGSLMSLAEAINASSAGVQASLVNAGSTASPNYRLLLRSADLGPVSMQLNDGSQNLLDTLNTGALASYSVNGLGTTIESASRDVTLAPGVTITLLQQTPEGQPTTVTVGRNLEAASSAISDFVNAYNTVVDDLNQQVGKDAGILSGQSIIATVRNTLRQITQYNAGSGTVSSLTAMGVQLDRYGKLSFHASEFTSAKVDALQSFLGDIATGGFLKAANDALNSMEDPLVGSLKSQVKLTAGEITRQNDLIAQSEQRLTDFQNNLIQRMAAADSLIASLESQRNYVTNLFTAMLNQNSGGVKS